MYRSWPIFFIYVNKSKETFSTIAQRIAFGVVLSLPFIIEIKEDQSKKAEGESVAFKPSV